MNTTNINQKSKTRRRLCRATLAAALSIPLYGCVTTDELYAEYDAQSCRVNLVKTASGNTVVQEIVSDRSMTWEPSVLFASRQSKLGKNQTRQLDKDVAVLKRYPELRVSVRGFADAEGSILFIQDLSARRAATVARYLINQGIARTRIQQLSLGEGMPIEGVEIEAAIPVNRRTELVLMDVNGNLVPYQVSSDSSPAKSATKE